MLEVEVGSNVFHDISQLTVPIVPVELETLDLAFASGLFEHWLIELGPVGEVSPGDVGSDVETRVENDGELLLSHGVVRALDVESQSEAAVCLITDNQTLGGTHSDWLRVALLGEGKDAIAVSR